MFLVVLQDLAIVFFPYLESKKNQEVILDIFCKLYQISSDFFGQSDRRTIKDGKIATALLKTFCLERDLFQLPNFIT